MDDDDDDDVDSFIWAVPGINVSLGGSRAAVALAEVTPNCVFETRHEGDDDVDDVEGDEDGRDVEGDEDFEGVQDKALTNSCLPLPLPQLT